jgi:hypothetical protein
MITSRKILVLLGALSQLLIMQGLFTDARGAPSISRSDLTSTVQRVTITLDNRKKFGGKANLYPVRRHARILLETGQGRVPCEHLSYRFECGRLPSPVSLPGGNGSARYVFTRPIPLVLLLVDRAKRYESTLSGIHREKRNTRTASDVLCDRTDPWLESSSHKANSEHCIPPTTIWAEIGCRWKA